MTEILSGVKDINPFISFHIYIRYFILTRDIWYGYVFHWRYEDIIFQWRTTTRKNIKHTSPEHERHLYHALMHTAPCTFGLSKIQIWSTINFEWWWWSQEVSWICLPVVVLHWPKNHIISISFSEQEYLFVCQWPAYYKVQNFTCTTHHIIKRVCRL